jgi:flagellar FliL protein
METVTENAGTYDAAAKTRRGTRGLFLVFALLVAVGSGSAAGAFGLLAPVYEFVLGHHTGATTPAPIYHPLPEFRVAIVPLYDARASSATSVGRHLRAVVQLEVETDHRLRVEALEPRIVDVLLTFLHALNDRDLASSQSLDRLKAQMLHRVRQVTGEDAVRSVLITDLTIL